MYTRWGKTYCPSGAYKVYDGFAAGSQYSTKGSGANFVCLTRSPVYSFYQSGTQNTARIAPVEMQPHGTIMGKYVWDRNAPCVVCHSKARKDVLMVPGTTRCPIPLEERVLRLPDGIEGLQVQIRVHMHGQVSQLHQWKPRPYSTSCRRMEC